MLPVTTLLSLVLFTLSTVDASPLTRRTGKATLGFTARINERGTGPTVADKDRARAQAMILASSLAKRDTPSFGVTNVNVGYTTEVGIGEPATNYTLLIDTGSSNTWIGANKTYYPTSSSHDTGKTVSARYGSGNFSGEEWTDTVTLSPQLVIKNQSIGVASIASGFSNVDGILGVGPTNLTFHTVSNTTTVPTVTDSLYSQGTIFEEVLGVYYVPASESNSDLRGELTFGGYDPSVITCDVKYVPLTTTYPASNYWGIDQSVSYGGETILSTTPGIVDTGTTLVLLATEAFDLYKNATGGIPDSATGLLSITPEQYSNLKTLSFQTADATWDLSPNAQIWPRSLNAQIGGVNNGIYLVVGDTGVNIGAGPNFVNGYVFLERFYSVFDTTNSRIGFATTRYTESTTN